MEPVQLHLNLIAADRFEEGTTGGRARVPVPGQRPLPCHAECLAADRRRDPSGGSPFTSLFLDLFSVCVFFSLSLEVITRAGRAADAGPIPEARGAAAGAARVLVRDHSAAPWLRRAPPRKLPSNSREPLQLPRLLAQVFPQISPSPCIIHIIDRDI